MNGRFDKRQLSCNSEARWLKPGIRQGTIGVVGFGMGYAFLKSPRMKLRIVEQALTIEQVFPTRSGVNVNCNDRPAAYSHY